MTPAVKSPQKKNDALNDDEDDSTDRLSDGFSFIFIFVRVFHLFCPNSYFVFFKFRISDLQTDGKKSLTADTTNSREGKSTFIIIIIIIMRA